MYLSERVLQIYNLFQDVGNSVQMSTKGLQDIPNQIYLKEEKNKT